MDGGGAHRGCRSSQPGMTDSRAICARSAHMWDDFETGGGGDRGRGSLSFFVGRLAPSEGRSSKKTQDAPPLPRSPPRTAQSSPDLGAPLAHNPHASEHRRLAPIETAPKNPCSPTPPGGRTRSCPAAELGQSFERDRGDAGRGGASCVFLAPRISDGSSGSTKKLSEPLPASPRPPSKANSQVLSPPCRSELPPFVVTVNGGTRSRPNRRSRR